MNNQYPCPITGCKHSRASSRQQHFTTLTTLIRHLHSHDHSQSQHLLDHSICHEINLYSCSHHLCLQSKRRFFSSKRALTEHNLSFHKGDDEQRPQSLSSLIFNSHTNSHLHNNWDTGTNFILENYDHDPPPFRTTWRLFLNGNNKKRFYTLQAKIIETIIKSNTPTAAAPYWWLLVHLELLILAPTSKKQRNNETISTIINHRLDDFQSGLIEQLFHGAFSIKSRDTTKKPPHDNGNRAAQIAADEDNYHTAIQRICATNPVATININNINIVEGLYSDPVPNRPFPPYDAPIQTHHLPGDICNTIRHAAKNKGSGINADSIDAFIHLVRMNDETINKNITSLFNIIYQGRIPIQARKFFTDTYLFCLHKDLNNLSKLRPIGIPTAIRRILASHIAFTMKDRFGEHLLPYNYAVGIDGGMDFIIKGMQLSIEKFIINPQKSSSTPSRAAVFIDLTNMFNLVSRQELFDIIHTHFPELAPLTTLIYEQPADVHFKWNTDDWRTIAMREGVNQGCPLSSTFASLVLNRVLQPLNALLHIRANQRLKNGDTGDDGFGGITHLFSWVDDISCTVPLQDLAFLLNEFKSLGDKRGCFINPEKTRILTSCNGNSILPHLRDINPLLAQEIQETINTYSIEKSTSGPIGIELTSGFRLLGTPVGSPEFANAFLLESLEQAKKQYAKITTDVSDLQTRLKLFHSCTLQKLPHLLGADVMHNLPLSFNAQLWPTWSSPFVQGINRLIEDFFCNLLGLTQLPQLSKFISHIPTSNGGLGILFPNHRAIPDFVITTTASIRRGNYGFRTSIDVEPTKVHPSITALFNTDTNHSSPCLARYHLLLPQIAQVATPDKCPPNEILTHFQTKLSTHSMRSRVKAYCANALMDITYESTYNDSYEHLHLLPSILVPQTSYPLISMCRSNASNRLPNWSFTFAMKRKLRLQLFPDDTPFCPCGVKHDKWGDHIFNCVKHNKIAPHHFIRDNWSLALQPALSLAGYISPTSHLETEKNNLIPSDPFIRPFDISFNPDLNPTDANYCNCPFSTVGADITITHSLSPFFIALTTDVQRKLTAAADKHLQKGEKEKYKRRKHDINTNTPYARTIQGETVIQELLDANTILLPFVIDPHGRWGPIMQNFLSVSQTTERITFKHDRPYATVMYNRSTSHPAPTAILHTADSHWAKNKTRRYFGHSHTAPTPQIQTIQQLGLGITKAFSSHIRNSINRTTSTHNTHNHHHHHLTDSIDDDISLLSTYDI